MPGLAGEIANLVVALKLDDSGFSGRLNAAARQLKAMDAGLSQVGRGVGQVGTGLDKIVTRGAIAAVGGLTAVISTAASMEEAFTGVEKTVDASDAQLEELRQTIRTLSSDTGTAFEDLAAIGEAGGALGVPTEDLDEFIDVINRLGVSTDLSTDQAATAMGQLRTILQLTGDDIRDVGDILVALGNDGASTESQIVDLAARFAAAGNQAGLTNEQIFALSSAVASMGIEVEAGGSSLSRLFNQTTTNIGTASEEASAFAAALGLSFDEFQHAWDTDAYGTFQQLLGVLGDLDQFQAASLLEDLGITNVRDVNAILLMAQNTEFLSDQLQVATDAQGALNKESDKFFGTGAAGFRRLRENLRLTADTIGTELLPVTNELISDFVTWLQEPEQQAAIKDFATGLADGIRDFVDEVQNADFGPLMDTLSTAAGIAKGAFDAFNALPSDVKALALAAFGINKVTGGALTDIAKGFGNIAIGGAKLILDRGSPTNPMWVTVTNPGFGGPGTGPGTPTGGGGKGRLPPLVGAAGAVGVALMLSGSDNPEALPGGADQAEITRLWERGLLTDEQYQTLFKLAYEGVDVSDELQAALQQGFSGQISGPPGGGRTAAAQHEEAASFDEAMLQRAVRDGVRPELSMLPDTAMVSPAVQAITTSLPTLRTKADQQLAAQYSALSAARDTTGAVRGLHGAIDRIDINPIVQVTVPVSVSNTMVQQTVTRTTTARGVPTAPNEIR